VRQIGGTTLSFQGDLAATIGSDLASSSLKTALGDGIPLKHDSTTGESASTLGTMLDNSVSGTLMKWKARRSNSCQINRYSNDTSFTCPSQNQSAEMRADSSSLPNHLIEQRCDQRYKTLLLRLEKHS
jgi:hypothetical protein